MYRFQKHQAASREKGTGLKKDAESNIEKNRRVENKQIYTCMKLFQLMEEKITKASSVGVNSREIRTYIHLVSMLLSQNCRAEWWRNSIS